MMTLIGTWHLVSCTIVNDDGSEDHYWGKSPKGVLIYDEAGNMAAQLRQADRPNFNQEDWSKGTHEEIKRAFQSYQAYYGTYELHEEQGYVIHHVEGAIFPNWQGQPEKRFFKIDGEALHITSPPIPINGKEFIFKLSWTKTKVA